MSYCNKKQKGESAVNLLLRIFSYVCGSLKVLLSDSLALGQGLCLLNPLGQSKLHTQSMD
jgi:hypothetical protein